MFKISDWDKDNYSKAWNWPNNIYMVCRKQLTFDGMSNNHKSCKDMLTSLSFYTRLPGDEPGMCPSTQNWLISGNQKPISLPAAATDIKWIQCNSEVFYN